MVLLTSNILLNILKENLVAEGPWMMYREGKYYLFYSSGWFNSAGYHMRVAVADTVMGPFSRGPKPVITTDWNIIRYYE